MSATLHQLIRVRTRARTAETAQLTQCVEWRSLEEETTKRLALAGELAALREQLDRVTN